MLVILHKNIIIFLTIQDKEIRIIIIKINKNILLL